MPRWISICVLTTVMIIVLHTLVSFVHPSIPTTWRTPTANNKSPSNTIDDPSPTEDALAHGSAPVFPPPIALAEEKTAHENQAPVQDAGPSGNEILLVVGTDGKSHRIDGMEQMVWDNRKQYVDLHGYDFMWANISEYRVGDAHPVWSKVPVLVDAFEKHPQAKWLWWLDIDAIIMSPHIDLASHVLSPQALGQKLRKGEAYHLRGQGREGVFHTPENPDPNQINLVITGDHNGINAGSFFLRRSDWTNVFLDFWLDPYYVERDWPGKEQDAIIHMMQYHKFVRDHVGIVPQRTMNAYSEGGDEMRWHPKDLLVHFAGCWVADACEERWKEFWAKRELLPGHESEAPKTEPAEVEEPQKNPSPTNYVDMVKRWMKN